MVNDGRGGDGSSSTNSEVGLEDVKHSLDGSASAGDGSASDGSVSTGQDGSASSSPFGKPQEVGTGRGPPEEEYENQDENRDEVSLGWRVVEDKDDSILPDRFLVTYDQTNNWFDESFFGRPTRDSSPGVIGKIASVAAHFPYFGNDEAETSDRVVKSGQTTPTPDGGEEYRGPEFSRRGVLHAAATGTGGILFGIDSLLESEGGNGKDSTPTPTEVVGTETPYNTETPTAPDTPTPTATEVSGEPSVKVLGEDENGLVQIEADDSAAVYDNQPGLPALDGKENCYPGKGEVVASYDSSDIEEILGSRAEDLNPYKGTLGLDIDQVDANVSGAGFDDEPEYIFQIVGTDDQTYVTEAEMEEIAELSVHEYNC